MTITDTPDIPERRDDARPEAEAVPPPAQAGAVPEAAGAETRTERRGAAADPDDDLGLGDDDFEDADDEDDDEAAAAPRPRPRRRRRIRRLHFHLGIWTLVSIALLSLFLVLSSMSLTGRVIVLPRWVAEQVLTRMNAAMPSGSFTLRQIEFGVTPKGRPRLRLVDVGVRDATGLDLAQINGVESGFKLMPALAGRLEPTVVRLTGAQVTLRRLSDGSFALSLGQETGASGSLAAVLDAVDAVFTIGVLRGAELVEAQDLTITLEDARSGRLWQVTDGRMKLTHTDRFVDTEVSFDVFNQTEELAHTVFSFRSAKDSTEASLSARFENAAARDIAAQSPALAFLSVIDAPISGALRTSVDGAGAISELAGTLSIGTGALSPTPGAQPARFDGAKVYIDYDPAVQRLDLLGAQVSSEMGTAEGEGHFYLADFNRGLPNSLIGQVTLSRGVLAAPGLFEAPLDIDRGMADFRIRLDPFTIELGQAVAYRGVHRYGAEGRIAARSDGWTIALDVAANRAERDEVLALWPVETQPRLRAWIRERVTRVEARGVRIAFRKGPGEKLMMDAVYTLNDALVKVLPTLPPVHVTTGYLTQGRRDISVAIEAGEIEAPDGSVMDLSGSSYRIADLTALPQIGEVGLTMTGPLEGALALLDLAPFNAFEKTSFGAEVARGQIALAGRAAFPLGAGPITLDQVDLAMTGRLTDLRSDVLIKDRLLRADSLDLVLSQEAVELSGVAQIGQAQASGSWHQPLGARLAAGERPQITGTMEISDRSLGEFNIALPDSMLTGSGSGSFTLDFPVAGGPRLELLSDLGGLGLAIPGTGWKKPAAARGSLALTAVLGGRSEVESLTIKAPGLEARGRITTAEGGQLGEARFEQVKLGGWFDGAVTLRGRGAGVPVAIDITSGTLNMGRANLAGGGGGGPRGPKQPLSLSLDRLIVSDSIRIKGLKGDFDLAGGLSGTFSGTVEGGARIAGTVAPSSGRSAFRITSADAGAVLRGAGVFSTARGGTLELILAPVGSAGSYEGDFTIKDANIVNSNSMLQLLSAVSVVGLLDQLDGEGISFNEIEGRFRLDPGKVTLYRSSAVGVSLGISLDGYYDMKNSQIDMQGVLSPFYLVNVLGRILSPRDGEGLIGFNFTIKGGYDEPKVQVNPLSILTPGAFREIFRRPPPEAPAQ